MRTRLALLTLAALGLGWLLPAAAADLVSAAEASDRAAVIAELAKGADAKTRSGDGTTALH